MQHPLARFGRQQRSVKGKPALKGDSYEGILAADFGSDGGRRCCYSSGRK